MDNDDPSGSQSPRDSLLKKPDSEILEGGSLHHIIPHQHSPFHGPHISENGDKDNFHGNDHIGMGPGGRFGGFRELGMTYPFQMMEDIFKSFGGFGMVPFERNPGVPMLPDPGAELDENPCDSFVKKDSDLDDRITGGFSDLLKDMPGYNPPVVLGQPSITPSEDIHPQPHVQQRYHSSSIVRIRKPDGSVEETSKYTDSTGREEVTVTHTQAEDGLTPGSLLRQGDRGVFDGHNSRHDHFVPSIFSWFFTR